VRFLETPIHDVFVIEIEPHHDARGFFARTWCEREASARGLELGTTQCSVSFNTQKGTLRGLHYQLPPFEEVKLVRCTAGAIWDVAVDIRSSSPTFGRHVGVELTARNRRTLYIPRGCAHGFITLANDSEVFYQMSTEHSADHARGLRWNDPFFGIRWPAEVTVISERDRTYQDFEPRA
jgi:dTDP-4-dehydrorhamnose 3,5-epimerase